MNKMGKGFTLIELLVVICLFTIVMVTTLIVVNPLRQFSEANNTKRRSDIMQILNAVRQYTADNKGSVPPQITTTPTNISKDGIDICSVLVTSYLSSLPTDPLLNANNINDCTVNYDTGYQIVKDAQNHVTVSAPSAELGKTISVK